MRFPLFIYSLRAPNSGKNKAKQTCAEEENKEKRGSKYINSDKKWQCIEFIEFSFLSSFYADLFLHAYIAYAAWTYRSESFPFRLYSGG